MVKFFACHIELKALFVIFHLMHLSPSGCAYFLKRLFSNFYLVLLEIVVVGAAAMDVDGEAEQLDLYGLLDLDVAAVKAAGKEADQLINKAYRKAALKAVRFSLLWNAF